MSNWKKAMMASAGGEESFFFATRHQTVTSQSTIIGNTVGCDNDGNTYVIDRGYDFIGSPVGASYQLALSKFDVDGNHAWSRGFFDNSANIMDCSSIDFDSSNNVYLGGKMRSYWTNNQQAVWGMVINSSGTKVVDVAWQAPGQDTLYDESVKIRHTGSGNFTLMAGFADSHFRMQNFSNTGTRNWAYKYQMRNSAGNPQATAGFGMDWDGSVHWVVGQQNSDKPFVCRVSSNGAGTNSRYYDFPSGRNAMFNDVSAKGSTLKLGGYTENSSGAPTGIYYNVSKSITTTSVLGGFTYSSGSTAFNDRVRSVDSDSAGNTYLSGFGYEPNLNSNYGNMSYARVVLKVNSSHSVDWARGLGSNINAHNNYDTVFVTPGDNIIIACSSRPTSNFKYGTVVGKLPADGSYTGAYTNLTPKEFTYGDETSGITTTTANHTGILPPSSGSATVTSESANSGFTANQITLYSPLNQFNDFGLVSLP